jgi:branched-chain amino acid aminotransferase
MKTSDVGGTVLDKPKSREAVKPAVDKLTAAKSAAKESEIYIDGKFYSESDAKVSVFDHGLLYGDGIFEGIRAYNGRVFKLREHIDRLFYSAKAILLDIPMSHGELMYAVVSTCRENNLSAGYIRLVVTRGVGPLGLSPNRCKDPSVIIIADKIQLYPPELYEKGMFSQRYGYGIDSHRED